MNNFASLFIAAPALMLGGCVSTVTGLATAPFKVVGQAADWATTSQDEADRNLGRKVRKQQEEEGKAIRRCQKDPAREECTALREQGLLQAQERRAQ